MISIRFADTPRVTLSAAAPLGHGYLNARIDYVMVEVDPHPTLPYRYCGHWRTYTESGYWCPGGGLDVSDLIVGPVAFEARVRLARLARHGGHGV